MNFDHISCFLSLCETLSFTATAKKLNLTQPSISRQIQTLEEQVNAKLFYRDKRQVRLTPEGTELKTRLAPLYEQMNELLQSTSKTQAAAKGVVNFGCLPEIGQYLFMSFLVRFQNEYPEIDVHTNYMLDDEIVEQIKAGTLDVGIIRKPVISENLRTYKIIDEISVLVTRSKNPNKQVPLKNSYFITYAHHDALLLEYMKSHMPKMDFHHIQRFTSVNSHKSMIDLLLSRDAYAVLPYFSVKEHIDKGQLRIIGDKDVHTAIYLTLRDMDPTPKRIELLSKFLVHAAKSTAQV